MMRRSVSRSTAKVFHHMEELLPDVLKVKHPVCSGCSHPIATCGETIPSMTEAVHSKPVDGVGPPVLLEILPPSIQTVSHTRVGRSVQPFAVGRVAPITGMFRGSPALLNKKAPEQVPPHDLTLCRGNDPSTGAQCVCRFTRAELSTAKKERLDVEKMALAASPSADFPNGRDKRFGVHYDDGKWLCSECKHPTGVHPEGQAALAAQEKDLETEPVAGPPVSDTPKATVFGREPTHDALVKYHKSVLGPEFAADIATTLDVADGRVTVTDVRLAAQTLRGADYLQLREELYLEQAVTVLRRAASEASDAPPSSAKEVVPCVHTGQLMWDRLGAYTVLRLEQMGIISLGHKGIIDARNERIDDELLACANVLNDVTSLNISRNESITTCEPFADTLVKLKADYSGITDEGLKLCTKLRKVNVSSVEGVTSCAPFAHTLEELDATESGITDDGLISCTKIRKLTVTGAKGITSCAPFANALEELDASYGSGLTDASLECCRKIRKFTICHSYDITTCAPFADTLEELVARGMHLTAVGIFCSITDESLKYCRKIRKLSIDNTPHITTCAPFADTLEELDATGERCGLTSAAIRDCTKLRKLDVRCNPRIASCDSCEALEELTASSGFTAASFQNVAEHCHRLKHLDLSHTLKDVHYTNVKITEVTDVVIQKVAEKCPQLQCLDLSGSSRRTDASIIALANYCPQLRSLNVSGNEATTDTSMIVLAKNCPDLEVLNVASTGHITDASIKKVAKHCPRLLSLNVSHTKGRITDASIVQIVKNCPSLAYLDARYTEGKVGGDALQLLLSPFVEYYEDFTGPTTTQEYYEDFG